jgi:Bacterial Ig-like domain
VSDNRVSGVVVLGAALANSSGQWTFTIGSPLADGVHNITATATSLGNVSAPSSVFHLTIDTLPPPSISLALALSSDSGALGDGVTN